MGGDRADAMIALAGFLAARPSYIDLSRLYTSMAITAGSLDREGRAQAGAVAAEIAARAQPHLRQAAHRAGIGAGAQVLPDDPSLWQLDHRGVRDARGVVTGEAPQSQAQAPDLGNHSGGAAPQDGPRGQDDWAGNVAPGERQYVVDPGLQAAEAGGLGL